MEDKRKTGMNFFRKTAFFMVLGLLLLTACGSEGEESGGAAISFTKEGTVQAQIKESFEESYYDKDELQQTILEEVAGYNRRTGKESITVEKVEVADGVAEVAMTYAQAEDYADFNQVVFFAGSPSEAESAGYDLNVVLSSVKNANDTVGKSDILAMKDVTVLITDEKEAIALNGSALYVSDNVTPSRNAKELRMAEEDKKLAYIIYK